MKYWPAPREDSWAERWEQFFVDRALHVDRQGEPVHLVEEVDDELLEERRIVNLAAGAFEDDAEHARLHAEFLEAGAVLILQSCAVERQKRFPTQRRRHNWFALVRRLGELVRHLEEEQQRQLLDVFEAGEPGVLQDAGITPGSFTDLRWIHQCFFFGGGFACALWFFFLFLFPSFSFSTPSLSILSARGGVGLSAESGPNSPDCKGGRVFFCFFFWLGWRAFPRARAPPWRGVLSRPLGPFFFSGALGPGRGGEKVGK